MTTAERAQAVDTALADIWEREQKASQRIKSRTDSILHSVYGSRAWGWGTRLTREEIEAAEGIVRAKVAAAVGYVEGLRRDLADLDKARADLAAARDEALPLEAEFNANRWPRFFLVDNVNGHIHSSMHCSTTFSTTQWSWLPDLSGLTEADAVAQQGTRLCSICFPSAPVEWTVGLPKKVNPNQCPGSGKDPVVVQYQYEQRDYRTGALITKTARRFDCPSCGKQHVNVNERSGVVRAHNLKVKKGASK